MIALLTTLSAVIAAVAALPLTIFSMETAAGLLPSHRRKAGKQAPTAAMLIPAHNEESGITPTLEDLRRSVPRSTRVVVIADNCTDGTAKQARARGVEVIERHDPDRRGKGYALAFGRDYLAANDPPEVVLVLDADCRLLPGSVEALAETAQRERRPAQAINLISPDLTASPMVQISGFAMLVKNFFRSRGMQRLGGAALLTGTGMAFPWSLYADAELATGSIVEDLEFGIATTRQGSPPLLVESANVRSAPAALKDALQQRKRWEHGFLNSLRSQAVPLFVRGLAGLRWSEILLGLHLMVPPLALLMVAAVAAITVTGGFWLMGASALPFAVLGSLLLLSLALVFFAWLARGREFLSGQALLRAPLYVLWKVPMYLSFFRSPESSWSRTRRPDE